MYSGGQTKCARLLDGVGTDFQTDYTVLEGLRLAGLFENGQCDNWDVSSWVRVIVLSL